MSRSSTARDGAVRAMTVRGLSRVLGLSDRGRLRRVRTPSRSAAIHLDGKRAQRDYVFETDQSGVRFLVPTRVLAGQRSQVFDVAAPTKLRVGEPNNAIITGRPTGLS